MFVPCFAVLSINSSFTLIPLGKRELIALFYLPSCCHETVSVPCLFLAVWLVDLHNVMLVFSGLLVLRIALSIAAYPILYLTYREQISL